MRIHLGDPEHGASLLVDGNDVVTVVSTACTLAVPNDQRVVIKCWADAGHSIGVAVVVGNVMTPELRASSQVDRE